MDAYRFFLNVFNWLTRFPTVIILAELLVCLRRPLRKPIGYVIAAAVCLSAYLILAPVLLDNTDAFTVGGWFSFVYAVIFAWSLVVIWAGFDVGVTRVLYSGLAAYIFQNTYYYIRELLDYAFPDGRDLLYFVLSFVVLCGMYSLFYFVFVRHFNAVETSPRKMRNVLIYACIVFLVVYVLHSMAVFRGEMNLSFVLFGIILNLILLVVLFDMFERSKYTRDNETIESMLVMSARQRRMSEENIDLINRKCHDLKYQIAAIRRSGNVNIESELLELENAVTIYDHTADTGNKTLDAVLTEKMVVCDKYGIRFNYMADTSALGVITSIVDVYSLFGNIMDNAIDGVRALPEEERIITLNVGTSGGGGILRIHADNRCGDNVRFEDGMPVTDKDSRYHGFGTKSIRYIAEKYGGNVVMRVEDRKFITDVMIPVR